MKKQIQSGILWRSLELDRASMDAEKRTVEIAFSSENPVERWFGNEILDHSPGSVDLSRLNAGGALLVEHDPSDQVGVVENARLDSDKKCRALVRFGSSERATEIMNDVKDGIRRLVSVGYRVKKMVREKVEEEKETYRATSWMPLELSIVAVPADATVGVGRSNNTDSQPIDIFMPDTPNTPAAANPPAPPAATGNTIDLSAVRAEATRAETARVRELQAMGLQMREMIQGSERMAEEAVNSGASVEQFRAELFQKLRNPKPIKTPESEIGMTAKDTKQYSLVRALAAMADRRPVDGFELEIHQECERKYGASKRGLWVPVDAFLPHGPQQRSDLVVGTASLGGNVVASNLAAGMFIEMLRNRMMVARLGAQTLAGLQGNVPIPRQYGAGTAAWAASELAETSGSNLTIDQITLSPKTVTALQDYSKQLLIQSTPSIEQMVRNDLLQIIALAIDLAAINGAGSDGQPHGIIGLTGIGSVTGGAHGAAPTWGNIVTLETEVATDNADVGTLAYLTNSKVRGKLKQTYKTTADVVPIWSDMMADPGFGMLNGYRAAVSNQVPSNLTKGTSTTICSAVIFGNWAELMIGQWGAIDLMADPYTAASTRLIKIYADAYVDIAVRHAQSFAAMPDALTT